MTREEAIKDIQENIKPFVGGKSLDMAIEALKAEPVKHGKWEQYLDEGLKWKCSKCGSRFATPWHYCPNCGAHMMNGVTE